MEKKIDEILNNFHLGKIDLIEVRKQLLILYGVMLPNGTLCVCDKRRPFPMENLTDWYCTNCGREIKPEVTAPKVEPKERYASAPQEEDSLPF